MYGFLDAKMDEDMNKMENKTFGREIDVRYKVGEARWQSV